MKMVQSLIALACLLAGADAFAPIPTKVPHHTHEEPDTHEVPHHTHESESPALSASPSPPPSAPIQPTCGAWVGGNNEDWFQIMIGPILSQQTFSYESAFKDPSELTCPDLVDEFGCAEPAFKLICAGTCKYSGACTADVALAHLWTSSDCEGIIDAPPPEFGCTMFAGMKPVLEAEEYDQEDQEEYYCDGTAVKKEVEEAGLAAIISISDEICKDSLSQDSLSRARKLTDAPRMDASKAHKLAAAMLRSIKKTADRLAQVRGLGQ